MTQNEALCRLLDREKTLLDTIVIDDDRLSEAVRGTAFDLPNGPESVYRRQVGRDEHVEFTIAKPKFV